MKHKSQVYIAIPGVKTRAGFKKMLRRHGHYWSVEPDFLNIVPPDRATTFALHIDSVGASGSGDLFTGPELRQPEYDLLTAALEMGEPVYLMRTHTDAPPELGSDPTSGMVTAAGFPEWVSLDDLQQYGMLPEHLVVALTSESIERDDEDEEAEEADNQPRQGGRRSRKRKRRK
jgi:hypothetical protein